MSTFFTNLNIDEPPRAPAPRGLPGPARLYRAAGKRAFDILFVLLTAPIALPLVFIPALLIALGHGQPFYVQERVGRGGRIFRMLKLRSMVHDADDRLEAYLQADPAARREWIEKQKLRNDPRITAFGHFLRKTSLDELPQLWNVLMGDMSIVGPRPMMVEQKKMYPGTAYYSLRPGITGPWQVSDRNRASFAERAVYDQGYDQTLSFGTDLKLLVRTAGAVCRATGH